MPSNFAKDAFQKDESVISGKNTSSEFQIFQIQKFSVFFQNLNIGEEIEKNRFTANLTLLLILVEFKILQLRRYLRNLFISLAFYREFARFQMNILRKGILFQKKF